MLIQNTRKDWGLVSILLHWLSAILIIGLFILGLYMTSLDYYSPWYHKAPHIHKSLGIILFFATLFRIGWIFFTGRPDYVAGISIVERSAATWVARLMMFLLFVITVSGYFISTADGRSVDLFNWLSIPSMLAMGEDQTALSGEVHFWLAVGLMGLVVMHTVAALKHHLVNKDDTLVNIVRIVK